MISNDTDPAVQGALAGPVYVDVSDADAERRFEIEMNLLHRAGWMIGKDPGSLRIGTLAEIDASHSAPAIICCAKHKDAERLGAVSPNAFAIIEALGGARLEIELVESVSPGHVVDKVVIGLNWTMVRSGDLCGIARSPSRDTEGARTIRPAEGFVGSDLRDLASFLCSMDPLMRSLGLAAVNAFWNRPEPSEAVQPYIADRGGLMSIEPPGDGAVIIGGFRAALQRLPKARIVEREPKPGDISVEDAPQAFRRAKTLAITAQTLMNGSLEPILMASDMVHHRMLIGPSSPVCPIVFEHRIDEAFGAVIVDPDAAETFIIESGTMIMLDHIATNRTIRARSFQPNAS